MKILSRIWPWSKLAQTQVLESNLAKSIDDNRRLKKQLATTIAASQSYRDCVVEFQTYCKRTIPTDVWLKIVTEYHRERGAHLTDAAKEYIEAAMTPAYPIDLSSLHTKIDETAMGEAWEKLRAKWKREIDEQVDGEGE